MTEPRPALLLLHGICNNSSLFSIPDGLGYHLSRDFDIFPYNYPISRHKSDPYDFDFHLNHDMPAIWRSVCSEAGCRPFVFGYSMGGMLAMAAQATGVIDAPAVITAASPFRFGTVPLYPPLMRTFVRLSAITGYRTVPIKVLGRALCALLTAAAPESKMNDLNLFRYLIKTASINVPVETFMQTLMWMKKRKFTDRKGKLDYTELFSRVKSPVCMIYGTHDVIAPQRAVKYGFEAVASAKKLMVSISDGTHMNMTIGRRAEDIARITAAWCCKED
jgi:pimeloyl-ACP methyl ester carboxylesterase